MPPPVNRLPDALRETTKRWWVVSNVIYAISDRELTEQEWFEKYCRPSEGVPNDAA